MGIAERGRGLAQRLRRSADRSLPQLEFPLTPGVRWGWEGRPPNAALAARLAAGEAAYRPLVEEIAALAEWAATVPRDPDLARPGEPCWWNGYWGTVDALAQVALLRRRDPALYLEVGSGHSTRFAARAIRDFGLRTQIISIDPAPRAEIDALCDEVIRTPLEAADPAVFAPLADGDVVLVDGSHMALANSDATVFLLELLPGLAPGVIVGIDDVFLPSDYPPTWWARGYGEQYLLAAFLLGGAAGWTVRFPGFWLVEHSPLAGRFAPLWPTVENRFGRHAASFWLERDAPPAGR